MRKFIGKSNERILCKLSKSCIQSFMLPWKQRKRHILPVDQKLSSVYFSLANFQLVSCNLSFVMIWQMTYTHKLPKLCSNTLKSEFALPQIGQIHVVVVQRRQRNVTKCTKKGDARAKLLFCLSKSISFLLYSLPSPSWLRKLTNIHT